MMNFRKKTRYLLSTAVTFSLLFNLSYSFSELTTLTASAQTTTLTAAEIAKLKTTAEDLQKQGKPQEALQIWQRLLDFYERSKDQVGIYNTLYPIAEIYENQPKPNYPEALRAYQRQLIIIQNLKDRRGEGVAFLRIGLTHYRQNNYTEAVTAYQQSLNIFREIKSKSDEILILGNLVALYFNTQQYDQAIKMYQQLVTAYREGNDRAKEGETLQKIADIHIFQNNYAQAEETLKPALELARQAKNQDTQKTILIQLIFACEKQGKSQQVSEFKVQLSRIVGSEISTADEVSKQANAYYEMSQYSEAIKHYEKALVLYERDKNQSGILKSLMGIGNCYLFQSPSGKGLEYYDRALGIARQLRDQSSEVNILISKAYIHTHQNEYPKALSTIDTALSLSQSLGDKESKAKALVAKGEIYSQLEQQQQAIKLYQEALDIVKTSTQNSWVELQANILSRMAGTYTDLKDTQKALQIFQESLALSRQVGNRRQEAASLHSMGRTYFEMGEFVKAVESFQQAADIAKKINYLTIQAASLDGISAVYFVRGYLDAARQPMEEAAELYAQIGNKRGEATIRTNLGRLYYRYKRFAEAETALNKAIALRESFRLGLVDENKISIATDISELHAYQLLQLTLIAQKKYEKGLEVAERSRARAFAELLAQRSGIQDFAPPNLQQIKEIARQQNATLVQYAPIDTFESDLSIWIVQPNGQITFRRTEAFNHTNNGTSVTIQRKPTVKQSIADVRKAMGVGERGIKIIPDEEDELEANQKLQELHKALIDPIADLLPKTPTEKVIFIPSGDLFLVPFPALQDAKGKYLIEKFTMLTAPSIQTLDLTRRKRLANQKQKQSKSLVIGNPTMPKIKLDNMGTTLQLPSLSGAEAEAKSIAKLLNVQPILGNNATIGTFKSQLSGARFVHIATHGLLDDVDRTGVPGALAFAPAGSAAVNNGLLTASEIAELKNLTAELVVLSACDTGRGKITGDGVSGLSRSFIVAGSANVLVSLWSVPDAPTAGLMQEFYRQFLVEKKDKAQALRLAMLHIMKQSGSAEPRDWAAFTLIGDVSDAFKP